MESKQVYVADPSGVVYKYIENDYERWRQKQLGVTLSRRALEICHTAHVRETLTSDTMNNCIQTFSKKQSRMPTAVDILWPYFHPNKEPASLPPGHLVRSLLHFVRSQAVLQRDSRFGKGAVFDLRGWTSCILLMLPRFLRYKEIELIVIGDIEMTWPGWAKARIGGKKQIEKAIELRRARYSECWSTSRSHNLPKDLDYCALNLINRRHAWMIVTRDLWEVFRYTFIFLAALNSEFNEMEKRFAMSDWASSELMAQLWSARLAWNGLRQRAKKAPPEVVLYSVLLERVLELNDILSRFFPVPHELFENISEDDTIIIMDAVDDIRKTVPEFVISMQRLCDHRNERYPLHHYLNRVILMFEVLNCIVGNIIHLKTQY